MAKGNRRRKKHPRRYENEITNIEDLEIIDLDSEEVPPSEEDVLPEEPVYSGEEAPVDPESVSGQDMPAEDPDAVYFSEGFRIEMPDLSDYEQEEPEYDDLSEEAVEYEGSDYGPEAGADYAGDEYEPEYAYDPGEEYEPEYEYETGEEYEPEYEYGSGEPEEYPDYEYEQEEEAEEKEQGPFTDSPALYDVDGHIFYEDSPSLHRRKSRRRFPVLLIALLVLILGIAGFFVYREYDSRVYRHAVMEAGTEGITPEDFKKKESCEVTFDKDFDISSVDTSVPGDYRIPLYSSPFHYHATLTIEDTVAPVGETEEVTLEFGTSCDAEKFVTTVTDVQEVTVSFAQQPDFSIGGRQEVQLLLTDASGNETQLTGSMVVIPVHYIVTVEAGSELPSLSDFIIPELSSSAQSKGLEMLTDLSAIDTTVPGEYEIEFRQGDDKFHTILSVEDTVAPVIKTAPLTGYLTSKLKAESFVEEAQDVTELTYRFETEPDYTKEGQQTVTIIATDRGGNTASEEAVLTLEKDTEAPKITGAMNMTAFKDHPVSYLSNVFVTDNCDEDIELQVEADSVNIKVPGTYEVVYRATDRAGNTAEVPITVTVIEESYSEETINALANEVLGKIFTPGMSDYDKLSAIYYWVRGNIAYTEMDIKDDWLKAAYYGLAMHKGDCFVYCMTSRALLNAAGFKNMVIDTVPLRYIHYWNLVDIGEGWRHFDTTPRASGGVFLYLDDASIAAYSNAHGNSHIYDKERFPDIP